MMEDYSEILNRAKLSNSKLFWNEELQFLLKGDRSSFLINISPSTFVRNLIDQSTRDKKEESEINFKLALTDYIENLNENIFDIDFQQFLLTLDLVKYFKPPNAALKLVAILKDFCSKIYEPTIENQDEFFQELVASINKYIVIDFKTLNEPDYRRIDFHSSQQDDLSNQGLQVLFQDFLFRTLNSCLRELLFVKTSVGAYVLIELIKNNSFFDITETFASHLVSKDNQNNFNLVITSFNNSKNGEKYRRLLSYLLFEFKNNKKVKIALRKRGIRIKNIADRIHLNYKNNKVLILNPSQRNEIISENVIWQVVSDINDAPQEGRDLVKRLVKRKLED